MRHTPALELIPLTAIHPSPYQYRTRFDDAKQQQLRADTNVLEKAAGYKRLTQPPCSLTLEEIAKRYGFSARSSVQRIIDLLDQPEAIQDLLSQNRLLRHRRWSEGDIAGWLPGLDAHHQQDLKRRWRSLRQRLRQMLELLRGSAGRSASDGSDDQVD
jgi:ParB-like chromosome segregation protein Spo0J